MSEPSASSWEKIFSSPDEYRIEMLKALLEEEEITSVVINKKDSAYVLIGEVELYVKPEDVIRAKMIAEQLSQP
ncbi:MAG: DUF2007 domain-containing protein [Bacteroidetes bacterium]|nr:DUF2007 domain-containing protein [Bacteroidota bacterium]